VKSKRSIWRLKTITDFFWAIVDFFGVFFATMFSVILRFFPHILFNDIHYLGLSKRCYILEAYVLNVACLRWRSRMLTEKDLALARNGMVVGQEVLEGDHMVAVLVGRLVD
jgi:hypothetical protein